MNSRGSDGGFRNGTRPWLAVWGGVFACSWGGNQFSPLLLMYEERSHYSSLMANVFLGVYVLGLIPALLIGGSLSDRHGRKPLMLAGIAATVTGSALLALGPLGPAFLAVGRLFSGIAVGTAMAVGTSWVTELSRPPFDPAAEASSGARRSSLAFIVGSAGGALVAGLIAQWGPLPEVLPFLIHIAVSLPFTIGLLRSPETQGSGGVPGPWWRQLRIPSAGHRRFVRVVAVAAPWLFAAAAIGYGYLPTQLRSATGSQGLLFATAATVVTLTASTLVQPLAKRLHSTQSARGLAVALLTLTVGIGMATASITVQSIWIGLVSSVVIGMGLGIALVSGLIEVQRIATPRDLAGLTGVFYSLAYCGFLLPALIAALGLLVPVQPILWSLVGLAGIAWLALLASSRRYLPSA